jgi:lipopolysaccharide transport system ATP-binding protein
MTPPTVWPESSAFIDLSPSAIFTDGSAGCVRVALCDADGRPTTLFEQGDTALFCCEFEALQGFEVAGCGVEFRDATGRVIHGKNSFQAIQTPRNVVPGDRLRMCYQVRLDIEAGDYWWSLGLASAASEAYDAYRLGRIGHLQFATQERCRVVDAGSFTVRLRASGQLTHHGIANLPGCDVALWEPAARALETRSPRIARPRHDSSSSGPTVVHVTHWKAGSQWIRRIVSQCLPDRVVEPEISDRQFLHRPVQAGKVYPTVYCTKQQFDRVHLPDDAHRFVVIRDLRDTLVSAYFSFAFSHPVHEPTMAGLRTALTGLDIEAGLLHLLRDWLPHCADIQATWLEAGEPLIHYEDLLEADVEILEAHLLDRCRLPVPRERFLEVVANSRFEKLTGHRRRGEEDQRAHERKGVAGDWKNHFTPRVSESFKLRFGALLIATGYARDFAW